MRWTISVLGGEVPILADDDELPRRFVLILAHGAGGHMEQKTIEWLAEIARSCGLRVVRFNFLYKALGKGMPDRMPVLIATYRAVIASVREQLKPDRLVIGGHSMGGRTASMIAAEGDATDGLLLFGYPLHPAGKPEKLRDAHLSSIKTPTLQLNGTEDELCTKEIMDRVVFDLDPRVWTLHWIGGADHSYSVSKASGRTHKDVTEEIAHTVENWSRDPRTQWARMYLRNSIPVNHYWDLVEYVWGRIKTYEGEETFLEAFTKYPREVGHLFAAHLTHAEICNGGFTQFFDNTTGVLAPEAIEAFEAIGLPEVSSIIKEAVSLFSTPYLRDRDKRMEWLWNEPDEEAARIEKRLRDLDDRFYDCVGAMKNRFGPAADAYARKVAPLVSEALLNIGRLDKP